MASPGKRTIPTEFDDLASIPASCPSPKKAKIHAVITTLSPIKDRSDEDPSKVPFFHGTVNDGLKKLKLVGFGETQQTRLSKFHQAKEPVTLNNCTCTLKKARNSTDIEVIVSDFIDIAKSDKSFNITDWSAVGPPTGVQSI